MHIDLGQTGAKRQSTRGRGLNGTAARIAEKYARSKTMDQMVELLVAECYRRTHDKEFLEELIYYAAQNKMRYYAKEHLTARASERKRQQIAKMREELLKKMGRGGAIMEYLVGEKAIGDLTGLECRAHEGLFGKLADRVKPNQRVREAVSEEDLRKIFS